MNDRFTRWLTGAPEEATDTATDAGADTPEATAAADPDPETEGSMSEEEVPVEDGAAENAPEDAEPLTVEDLEYRIDELEAELGSVANTVSATQRTQEDTAETIEDLDTTVRRLLGVYDRLTSEANPFTDGGSEDHRFDLLDDDVSGDELDAAADGAPETDPEPPVDDESGADHEDGTDPVPGEPTPEPNGVPATDGNGTGNGETVTFADLKRDAAEPAPESEPEREPEPVVEPELEQEPEREPTETVEAAPAAGGEPDPDPALLSGLGEGYSTDVLVFQWLSMLVEESGPAGALKALDYYETVDWIGPRVREHLETALGGPVIDVDVDPAQPRDLTADNHADSYEYVLRLRELGRLNGPVHAEG